MFGKYISALLDLSAPHLPISNVFDCFRPHIQRMSVAAAAMREVSVAEASELSASSAYTYLDVRTPEEFAAGHAPNSINIPVMLSSGGAMVPNPDFAAEVRGQ